MMSDIYLDDLSLEEKVKYLYAQILERIHSWKCINKHTAFLKGNVTVDFITGFGDGYMPLACEEIYLRLYMDDIVGYTKVGQFVDHIVSHTFFELDEIINESTHDSVRIDLTAIIPKYYSVKVRKNIAHLILPSTLSELIETFGGSFPNYYDWDHTYPDVPNPLYCLLHHYFFIVVNNV